jgi:hypothetical protein
MLCFFFRYNRTFTNASSPDMTITITISSNQQAIYQFSASSVPPTFQTFDMACCCS